MIAAAASSHRGAYTPHGVWHVACTGEDDDKTLEELKFQTGDFLDVAIHTSSYPDRP